MIDDIELDTQADDQKLLAQVVEYYQRSLKCSVASNRSGTSRRCKRHKRWCTREKAVANEPRGNKLWPGPKVLQRAVELESKLYQPYLIVRVRAGSVSGVRPTPAKFTRTKHYLDVRSISPPPRIWPLAAWRNEEKSRFR
jgi:hypothetical protein